jgi:uncharacterized membrane protein YhaH (DUF805 family)
MHFVKLLFSLEGRIDRLQFWASLMIITAFTLAITLLCRYVASMEGEFARIASVAAFCVWLFILAWSLVAVSAKRWHDMHQSGMMSFLWLIPIIGPVLVIAWLGFGQGKNAGEKNG